MIETTYRCDGCGRSSSAQAAHDWRVTAPVGSDLQRLPSSPLHSHLCEVCWRVAMDAVHSRVLEPGTQVIPAIGEPLPTVEMRAVRTLSSSRAPVIR